MQRSWLYQQDPSLRAANAGFSSKDQVAFFDNANSLPMGEGVFATRVFSDQPGAQRRMRTDITMNAMKNQIITKK